MRSYGGEDFEGFYAWSVYLNISTSHLYVDNYIDNMPPVVQQEKKHAQNHLDVYM